MLEYMKERIALDMQFIIDYWWFYVIVIIFLVAMHLMTHGKK